MEAFFLELPLPANLVLIFGALFIVVRSAHYLVEGAVHLAHEFRISPLVIGATLVAVGTSAAELAINLVIVLSGEETAAIVGNILGSNLVNFGVGLGVPALIAGLIVVPQDALGRDVPLYFAATGLLTALIVDGVLGWGEAIFLLLLFALVIALIVQYARARHLRTILMVEVTELETIAHPGALYLSRRQALLALGGGLVVLVLASRLLVFNTVALASALNLPQFIIGLVIIGPGTSLPEIASAIQAARRGQADLVIGMAVGSNLFNLLFGLGMPALFRPLVIEETALQSFIFMNVVNLSLLALVLLDFAWLGGVQTINRVIGSFLLLTYLGFIAYQVVSAAGGTLEDWLKVEVVLDLGAVVAVFAWRSFGLSLATRFGRRATARTRILVATRGGKDSQPTHQRAIALAREQNGELIFLYVFDEQVLQRVATPMVFNVEAQVKRMLSFLQTTAQEQARQAGVPARVIVRTGGLREQLSAVAKEEQINLIVLGSPSGEQSLFQREALLTLAGEVEEATGVRVLILDEAQQEAA